MLANTLLSGEALRAAAAPWLEELGKSDRDRLEALLGLAFRERVRLSDCLAALFPGVEVRKSQTALTSFRKRLNDAARGEGRADLGLRFHVDTKKQTPPDERFCWFTGPDPVLRQAERYSDQVTADVAGRRFVPSRGIATTGNGNLDALDALEAWATDPRAPPFFALLGEHGIGKTTTLKRLTRRLLKGRRSRPERPLPIYVDLRDDVGDARDSVPTVEQLLARVLQRSWKPRDRPLTPQDVLRLVQEEGALILLDGLDEKLAHLPPDRARDFIRTLRGDSLPPGKRRGKLLIACRFHSFRDVWSQDAMLVGEDREGLDRNPFPALCLLPSTEKQIHGYLASFLGDPWRGQEAFEVLASIHELRDLAERPSLLTFISGHLGQLEDLRARGEKVNAARLYDLVVRSWLNPDDGKHPLDPVHKRRLMEDLAATLWRDGTREWKVERIETWLDDKDRAVLEEHFRFAHTSLREYFLAAWLVRALVEGRVEHWDLPKVSRKALDFVGQILDSEPQPAALRSMEAILGGENLRAALLALAYWLRALEQRLPVPAPARVKLAGANLEEWRLRGRDPTQPLNLRGADLSSVRLSRARVEHVDLSDADLTDMAARQALFLNVSAPRARARGADLRGLRWREGSLQNADLSQAQLAGCQWIRVGLTGAALPEGWKRHATAVAGRGDDPLHPTGTPALTALVGHFHQVRACAWSPDGQHILSCSDDHSLKVWDAHSGDCLLTLSGHSNGVNACAWSPDGQRLLSGSRDCSLKVWDARSGDCLLTLPIRSAVEACAWSPDGQRLLSGSLDGALKIWDAHSGDCLLTLSDAPDFGKVCAWSPDGQRLLSSAHDGSLKVWDADSGECLLTLAGHSGPIRTCAWSPNGQHLLSISYGNTLKVWDASSGQCIWSGHLLPEGQTASIDEVRGRILHASSEAWRWLGWRWTDPATGRLRILPAETFGPLPS